MVCGIYAYRDNKTGKIVYVGKDSHIEWHQRHKDHLQPSQYDHQPFNRVLQNNTNRYGYEIILRGDISEKLLNGFEKAFIRMYDPKFNFTIGGDGTTGYKHTDEAKRKISESQKGNTHWKGKKHSEETKIKIGKAHKGKIISEEHKQKLREYRTGRKHSEETKRKISEAIKGENNPNYGKKFSDEHRRKLSESHKKKYATMVKRGIEHNKQRYSIRKNGKYIKTSINRAKLLDWFTANYPKEILILNIDRGV